MIYQIGELARLADATPDTTRYYEKQKMMRHHARTGGASDYIMMKIYSILNLFVMLANQVSHLMQYVSCYLFASNQSVTHAKNQRKLYNYALLRLNIASLSYKRCNVLFNS